jgi:hypothetical protein
MNYETKLRISSRFNIPEQEIETLLKQIRLYPWRTVLEKFNLKITRINQSGSYILLCPFHQERTP